MGWEPNPAHTDHLRDLESAYNKCGWKVVIYTATGVGAHNQIGKVRIYLTLFWLHLHEMKPEWSTALIRDHDVATPALLCHKEPAPY